MKSKYPLVHWTEEQLALAIKLFQEGFSPFVIGNRLNPKRTRTSVMNKLHHQGLFFKESRINPYAKPSKIVRDTSTSIINRCDEKYGKVNPFLLAETELRQDFKTFHDTKFYKGKRLRTYADWTPAIQDLNRLRDMQGLAQITYNREWAINGAN